MAGCRAVKDDDPGDGTDPSGSANHHISEKRKEYKTKKADPVLYDAKKADREKLRKFRNDQHAKLVNAIKALDKKPVERVVKNMLEIATDSIKSQIDRLKKQVDKNDDYALSMQKEYYAWLQDGKRLIENIKRNTK